MTHRDVEPMAMLVRSIAFRFTVCLTAVLIGCIGCSDDGAVKDLSLPSDGTTAVVDGSATADTQADQRSGSILWVATAPFNDCADPPRPALLDGLYESMTSSVILPYNSTNPADANVYNCEKQAPPANVDVAIYCKIKPEVDGSLIVAELLFQLNHGANDSLTGTVKMWQPVCEKAITLYQE